MLELLSEKFPGASKQMAKILPVQVRHHMRFSVPSEDLKITVPGDHLPLPPPPRIRKKDALKVHSPPPLKVNKTE